MSRCTSHMSGAAGLRCDLELGHGGAHRHSTAAAWLTVGETPPQAGEVARADIRRAAHAVVSREVAYWLRFGADPADMADVLAEIATDLLKAKS
jgi:hypothetical protein